MPGMKIILQIYSVAFLLSDISNYYFHTAHAMIGDNIMTAVNNPDYLFIMAPPSRWKNMKGKIKI